MVVMVTVLGSIKHRIEKQLSNKLLVKHIGRYTSPEELEVAVNSWLDRNSTEIVDLIDISWTMDSRDGYYHVFITYQGYR